MTARIYKVGVWGREERRDAGLRADYYVYVEADDEFDAEEIACLDLGRGHYTLALSTVTDAPEDVLRRKP